MYDFTVFDDEYQELLSYPSNDCCFCTKIKQSDAGILCMESDRNSFQQCKADRKQTIYHCHAGLVEAVIPLVDNHIVIGYLMFGQISDAENRKTLKKTVFHTTIQEKIPELEQFLDEIPVKSYEEIIGVFVRWPDHLRKKVQKQRKKTVFLCQTDSNFPVDKNRGTC